MGGGRAFMTQPQGDDSDIVARLQEVEGGGVANPMRGDFSSLERGALQGGLPEGAAEAVFNAEAGEPLT